MTLHIIVPVYNAAQYLLDAVNSIVSELPNVLFPVQMVYYTNPLYVYRKNEHSVTSNYTRNALEYYDVLLLGWRGYLQWLESMDQSEDVTRAISFVKQRINCTCMYAARNFCIWHNGSYKDFLRNIIGELWLKQMISPVSFGDKSLRNDYCLINKRPLLFYIKYRLKSLFCWEM